MVESVTVSAKIPKQLKEKMQHFNIKPSKILRKALKMKLKKERARAEQEINNLKPTLEKVSMQNIVKNIREDRDSR